MSRSFPEHLFSHVIIAHKILIATTRTHSAQYTYTAQYVRLSPFHILEATQPAA
jgi:hypothetical protein